VLAQKSIQNAGREECSKGGSEELAKKNVNKAGSE
jgi:hypothetical protein